MTGKLFDRYSFLVVEINDKDIDSVIIKLYEEISGARGAVVSVDFIGYKIANENQDFRDVAMEIYERETNTASCVHCGKSPCPNDKCWGGEFMI